MAATQALMSSTIANGAGPKAKNYAAAAAAASPAGAPISSSDSSNKDVSSHFGSERIVDIIRREQANQMQQARSKGTTVQAQKVAAVPHGSGEAPGWLEGFKRLQCMRHAARPCLSVSVGLACTPAHASSVVRACGSYTADRAPPLSPACGPLSPASHVSPCCPCLPCHHYLSPSLPPPLLHHS
jgi:hypothetical protein